MSSYVYFETTFENIYDLWNEGLWPDRISKIEDRSALFWNPRLWEEFGNISITKQRKKIWEFEPTFWAIKEGDRIVGVNSGFKTDDDIYRSRGLYITPEKRGTGLSRLLLKLTIETAKKEKCRIIWTMPRKLALFAYESVGFYKIGNWLDEGVEFGPNCIAIKEIL
jgi:GNAT superfamily N-acetyltransferase